MVDVLSPAIGKSKWDQATKDAVYEIFAHACNGDMICTLRTVAELDLPTIPEKTVYDWRTRYDWDGKLQAEKQAIAPISWDLYFGGLAVAAPESVSYLRSVIADESESTRNRIAAARALLGQVASHIEQLNERSQVPEPDSISDQISDDELLELERSVAAGGTGLG